MRASVPVADMNEYPKSQLEWGSFYAKSAMAVRYLATQHKEQFAHFWLLSKQTNSFNAAFYQAFYHSVAAFSQEMEGVAKREVAGYIILVLLGLLWSLFPILLIMGYLRKKAIGRQQPVDDENDGYEYMEGDAPDETSPETEPEKKD
jgi:hypothetical protein